MARRVAVAYLKGLLIAAGGVAFLILASYLPGGSIRDTITATCLSGGGAFLMRRRKGELEWRPRPEPLLGTACFAIAIYVWMLPRLGDGSMTGWLWVLVALIWAVPIYLLVVGTRLILADARQALAANAEQPVLGEGNPLEASLPRQREHHRS